MAGSNTPEVLQLKQTIEQNRQEIVDLFTFQDPHLETEFEMVLHPEEDGMFEDKYEDEEGITVVIERNVVGSRAHSVITRSKDIGPAKIEKKVYISNDYKGFAYEDFRLTIPGTEETTDITFEITRRYDRLSFEPKTSKTLYIRHPEHPNLLELHMSIPDRLEFRRTTRRGRSGTLPFAADDYLQIWNDIMGLLDQMIGEPDPSLEANFCKPEE